MRILTINFGKKEEVIKDVMGWEFFGSEMIVNLLDNHCEVLHLKDIQSYSWKELPVNRAQRRTKK